MLSKQSRLSMSRVIKFHLICSCFLHLSLKHVILWLTTSWNDFRTHGLLLTSSKDEVVVHGSPDNIAAAHQYKGNGQWETLELYLVSVFFMLQFLLHNSSSFPAFFGVNDMIKWKEMHWKSLETAKLVREVRQSWLSWSCLIWFNINVS